MEVSHNDMSRSIENRKLHCVALKMKYIAQFARRIGLDGGFFVSLHPFGG